MTFLRVKGRNAVQFVFARGWGEEGASVAPSKIFCRRFSQVNADQRSSAVELLIQTGMDRSDVRDPEHLSINLDAAESVLRQILFLQTEKREVR